MILPLNSARAEQLASHFKERQGQVQVAPRNFIGSALIGIFFRKSFL
jgi:hypothetical protein